MIRFRLLPCLAFAGLLLFAGPAQADRRLTGDVRAITIDENVIIPKGKKCTLTSTTINGDITVSPGATLVSTSAVVSGSLVVKNAKSVTITGTNFGKTGAFAGTKKSKFSISGSQFPLNLTFTGGAKVSVTNTTLGASLVFNRDTGEVEMKGLTVAGSLSINKVTKRFSIDATSVKGYLSVFGCAGPSTINATGSKLKAEIRKHKGTLDISATGFDGDLELIDNSGRIYIETSTIKNNLVSSGNRPAPVLDADTVDVLGEIQGPVELE